MYCTVYILVYILYFWSGQYCPNWFQLIQDILKHGGPKQWRHVASERLVSIGSGNGVCSVLTLYLKQYWKIDPYEKTSMRFDAQYNDFHSTKCMEKVVRKMYAILVIYSQFIKTQIIVKLNVYVDGGKHKKYISKQALGFTWRWLFDFYHPRYKCPYTILWHR